MYIIYTYFLLISFLYNFNLESNVFSILISLYIYIYIYIYIVEILYIYIYIVLFFFKNSVIMCPVLIYLLYTVYRCPL